jgi:hypothetical protein
MTTVRKNISGPEDHFEAWEDQAEKHNGGNLSEFIGERVNSTLPKRVAAKLTERLPAHRPKSKTEPGG